MDFDDLEDKPTFTISEDKIFCDHGVLEYWLDEDGAIVNSISVYRKRLGTGTKLVRLFESLAEKQSMDRCHFSRNSRCEG